MLNSVTVLFVESATNRNLPLESRAIATGFAPAATVDAGGLCKHPGPPGQAVGVNGGGVGSGLNI